MYDNAERGRFELDIEGQTVYADYQRREGILVIRHVYAPPPLRGTGAADRLMHAVARSARAEGRRIAALCGYAGAWLRAQPEHRDLLV
ncbi:MULTISPECIES: GNAT family N-acetyltransferase [Methylobacterium]|uniref:GNAT family N-acetyltransferase n=1 Tax=Methylobacterium TaxID=407 RepID=UPI00104D0ACC|nr:MULTISPECIES: GNAT family N-acetyltransferase [Methylobacterium]MDR7035774.1 putative GNAT family acetyltransferase [Methylobacterium sp. BE186]